MSVMYHFDVGKYVDLNLKKVEITPSKTEFEICPSLFFHISIGNNSDLVIEFERMFYEVLFKLPLDSFDREDFVTIGIGYMIVKDILNPRETRDDFKTLFEIPHMKVMSINKTLKEAKTIDGLLEVHAFFTRYPTIYQTLPLFAPPTIRAWSEISDFPPIGRVCKEFEFKIPIDEWEKFVERVRKSL